MKKLLPMLAGGLLIALNSGTAHAQFLNEGTLTNVSTAGDYFAGGVGSRGHIYVLPNELNPEAAAPILASAEAGAYVSVGAERGLLGALLSPNVTHLVQIDLVPEVVRYNQLNVVLMKVAENLPDYLKLRDGAHAEWMKRSTDARLIAQERALLASAESAKFYQEVEGGARERLLNPNYFKGSSYLKSPELFARAQVMARANRIQVLQGNLTDSARLNEVAKELQARNIKISVLDMSNAWEEKYVGPTGVNKILKALEPALRPSTIALGTSVESCIESHLCFWDFRGYTVSLLKQAEKNLKETLAIFPLYSKKRSPSPNKLMTSVDQIQTFIRPLSQVTLRQCSQVFAKRN